MNFLALCVPRIPAHALACGTTRATTHPRVDIKGRRSACHLGPFCPDKQRMRNETWGKMGGGSRGDTDGQGGKKSGAGGKTRRRGGGDGSARDKEDQGERRAERETGKEKGRRERQRSSQKRAGRGSAFQTSRIRHTVAQSKFRSPPSYLNSRPLRPRPRAPLPGQRSAVPQPRQ